jgi:tRNA-splicing ligase RtcB
MEPDLYAGTGSTAETVCEETTMGLTKKERQEKREAKLAEKRTAKRSERNALREAIGDFVAGATDDVVTPEPARSKKRLGDARDAPVTAPQSGPGAPSRGGSLHLEQVGTCRYEIPVSSRPFMRVPGLLIADGKLLDELRNDPALEQLANMTALPGIVGRALAMPDCHWGYGFPVGGVAATRVSDGVVSPGGVGYDINCGVRLLRSQLTENDLERRKEKLADALFLAIPSGVGVHEGLPIGRTELHQILAEGVPWSIKRGFGLPEDLANIESGGRIPGANPDAVSKRAVDRGFNQLGTLGSGNHFFEVQVVDEIYDHAATSAMGLAIGQVCVLVHSGSRGLGHQVCQDALDQLDAVMSRYGIRLPDRQLACAPIDSPEGQRYLGAMRAAANFAFVNRQGLTHRARGAFRQVYGAGDLEIVYDVAHNIAKEERYVVDGRSESVLVHRKGATRAFPAGHPEIPAHYATVGQPVLIPGDMGRYSFVAVGTEEAMRDTFGSICHGAGRHLSRSAAKKELRGVDLVGDLKRQGIFVRTPSPSSLAEEASLAYKDVADVVDVCERAGIARKVARLRPRVVVKG